MENTNSQSLEDKIKKVEGFLQKYAEERCIFENKKLNVEEIHGYMQMDRQELRALSADDCGEIAYLLGQLALEIQREVNKQTAIEQWLEAQINKTVADLVTNYKIFSYEGQKHAAIKDNEYARKCQDTKMNAIVRIKQLNYMSQEIKNLSGILMDIRQTKMRYKDNA